MSTNPVKRRLKKFMFILLCGLFALLSTANCKPTVNFPFSLPSLPSFQTFQQYIEKKQADSMKSYSGRRLDPNSLRMIYYNDQTIAIVELGPRKLLVSCELIEIYNDEEGVNLLGKLSRINKPFEIGFKDMMKLMEQCDYVDKRHEQSKKRASKYSSIYQRDTSDDTAIEEYPNDAEATRNEEIENTEERGILASNPFSLLSGVFPGSKWCGTGDIAKDFHDLGREKNMDRCCRLHDICPIKVRAYQQRYNLTNNSIYTKSHCECDDLLYTCLKEANTPTAQLMGQIYFNLVQVPCVEELPNGEYQFRKARDGF